MHCVFSLQTYTACYRTVLNRKKETHLFMLRVLVGVVILYDHVHPNGAFVKTSNVNVKGCIKLLKEQPEEFQTENLLNALRYIITRTVTVLMIIINKNKTFLILYNIYEICIRFLFSFERRYTTAHLNDPTTSKTVRALLTEA